MNRHKPAVEALLRPVARFAAGKALSAMPTGMGTDGAAATPAMKDADSYKIAPDEAKLRCLWNA